MKVFKKVILLLSTTILLVLTMPMILIGIPMFLSNYKYFSQYTAIASAITGIMYILVLVLVALFYYSTIKSIFQKRK